MQFIDDAAYEESGCRFQTAKVVYRAERLIHRREDHFWRCIVMTNKVTIT